MAHFLILRLRRVPFTDSLKLTCIRQIKGELCDRYEIESIQTTWEVHWNWVDCAMLKVPLSSRCDPRLKVRKQLHNILSGEVEVSSISMGDQTLWGCS